MDAPLRVAVRNAAGEVFGKVEVEAAAIDDVQLLHADPDAQHGHPALLDQLTEQTIGVLAAVVHQSDRGMGGEAHLPRVEVVATGEENAVEPIEDRREIGFLGERR